MELISTDRFSTFVPYHDCLVFRLLVVAFTNNFGHIQTKNQVASLVSFFQKSAKMEVSKISAKKQPRLYLILAN